MGLVRRFEFGDQGGSASVDEEVGAVADASGDADKSEGANAGMAPVEHDMLASQRPLAEASAARN